MPKNESLTRSLMLLCVGTSVVLFSASWRMPEFDLPTLPSPAPTSPRVMLLSEVLTLPRPHLVVDLSDRRVYLYFADRPFASYPVAVGQAGWETPTGSFKVTQMLKNPAWIQPITGEVMPSGPDSPLGDRWIGFWSSGKNQIGFHGTPKEHLIGQAVSHGCLRMRNQDIRELYKQVSLGTQVIVRQ